MSNNPVDVSLYVSDESNCAGFKTVLPKPSTNWHCQLFGGGPTGMILIPPEGKEPIWFWRWMQYVCFGNKWVRKKPFGARRRENELR